MALLDKLRRKPRETGTAAVPEGLRLYAVGDVHGRADLLAELHVAIAEDAAEQRNRTDSPLANDRSERPPAVRTAPPTVRCSSTAAGSARARASTCGSSRSRPATST